MRKIKRLVSLSLVVVLLGMLFATPVSAARAVRFESTSGIVTMELSNDPQLRFPGYSGLYGVKAHPAIMALNRYTPDYYSYSLGNGRTQHLSVTLDSSTRNMYNQVGADGYLVAVDMNIPDAVRYEVTLNGVYVGGGSCAGYNRAILRLMLYNENPAAWKITLYDNTSQGKPLSGYVYYS